MVASALPVVDDLMHGVGLLTLCAALWLQKRGAALQNADALVWGGRLFVAACLIGAWLTGVAIADILAAS